MKLHFERLYTRDSVLENQLIECEKGQITHITSANVVSHKIHASYPIGCAGFVDIQVNGGGGVLFNQVPSAQTLAQMHAAHLQFGTSTMLPTVITDCVSTMQSAANAITEYRKQSPEHKFNIAGIHFEGPWLANKRKGVHPAQFLRQPTLQELDLLRCTDLGTVKVTLAPEQVKPEIIRELVADNIIVFLGHSDATIDQVEKALEAGASGFTHLFNAMSPMLSRAPGMVGAALSHQDTYAGIIVDGHHVDAACLKTALYAKGAHRLALVTDAMAIAASELTSMPFFEQTITKQDNKLTIADGTLAGSCLTMLESVQNMVNLCDASLIDALNMASSTPAEAIGLGKKLGSIAEGMPANILGLNESLAIEFICHHGTSVNKMKSP